MSLMRTLFLAVAALSFVAVTPTDADARKPADALGGRVILAKWPFPTRFKNDRAFIAHMKKVDNKRWMYAVGEDKIPVEFMVFLKRALNLRTLDVTIFDITDRRVPIENFPLDLRNPSDRVVASNFTLDRERYNVERQYHLVVRTGYSGRVVAETKFAIKRNPKAPKDKEQGTP
jgi:hypothetical protein